ncbi:MAG: Pantoate--beta-alanine ligase (EC [uncultured Thiotrichaceae bacterium]|uniref:Pantothenate synthetase n=1 Tax=uncultured Thiotrichaceae bacterium TaxID=298394 RepID=A0A6S6TX75_9GAMM|nr:MAG: Pantoate--beta-alanine ligase (EC [uncultured Thiotrichaceae bacterium]
MIITSQKDALREQIKTWRQEGQSIAFVPTMGNLHLGHLALVEKGRALADKVVTSIFVNPTQFDNAADLDAYPHTLQDDCQALQKQYCDLVFTPDVKAMYSDTTHTTRVSVPGISSLLEGASREGHFDGVSTIVTKLFNLVTPDMAIFGEKDFQQLMVVRQMVRELDFDIEIIGHPTQRDADGLALSSRNGYLTKEERAIASTLYATLTSIVEELRNGSQGFKDLAESASQTLNNSGFKTDYIEIRRQHDLLPATENDEEIVILAAAWLGKARLIDNIAVNLNIVN